jgi:hypothetical protein
VLFQCGSSVFDLSMQPVLSWLLLLSLLDAYLELTVLFKHAVYFDLNVQFELTACFELTVWYRSAYFELDGNFNRSDYSDLTVIFNRSGTHAYVSACFDRAGCVKPDANILHDGITAR